MRYAPFFFFFEFRPDWAVSADTGRYGRYGPSRPISVATEPISAASVPISAASARFENRHVARRGKDARSAASFPRRRIPPRRTRVRWPGSRVRASQVQRENTYIPPFIFLSPHPTKHTPKSFHSYFLSKIFHLPYFTSKQTHQSVFTIGVTSRCYSIYESYLKMLFAITPNFHKPNIPKDGFSFIT